MHQSVRFYLITVTEFKTILKKAEGKSRLSYAALPIASSVCIKVNWNNMKIEVGKSARLEGKSQIISY